ncbi:MAG: cell division protein FtsZ [Bacteroidales bacterium]|nr:cell division protein FtsZ [Bacteroidales bacterium]
MPDSQLITFDSPLEESSYIKVIGVGGGGNNAVNHMYRKGISGVDFIVSNTDMKALKGSPVPTKLVLGHEGLGVGGRPAKARKAAEEREAEIKQQFEHNTKMVFITAGMGGGTGTGAAPVIARMAKEIKLENEDEDDPTQILVVAVVTTPFLFEGYRRIQQAQEGVEELRKYVDSILVINNEKLRSYGNLVMTDAFAMANDVLLTAVKGIAEIITLNAYVNIDFRDVYTVMENSGTALMGIGEGEGENRARQAVEEATTSVLLNDNDIAGAKNVLLNFSFGPDHEITMDEMGEVTDYITSKTGSMETNVIWGMGSDETLGDKVKITLIATGFEQREQDEPIKHVLKETPQVPQPKPGDLKEPVILQRPADEQPIPPINHVVDEHKQPAPDYQPPTIETVNTPISNTRPTVEPLAPKPETTNGKRGNVYTLDDEPEQPQRAPKDYIGNSDDDIRLRPHNTPEPIVTVPESQHKEPEVQPIHRFDAESLHRETVAATSSAVRQDPDKVLDQMAQDRAERIKAIHNLLRNDVNGPQKVEAMTIDQLTGQSAYDLQAKEGAIYSAQSEATSSTIAPDGTVRPNSPLYSLPD